MSTSPKFNKVVRYIHESLATCSSVSETFNPYKIAKQLKVSASYISDILKEYVRLYPHVVKAFGVGSRTEYIMMVSEHIKPLRYETFEKYRNNGDKDSKRPTSNRLKLVNGDSIIIPTNKPSSLTQTANLLNAIFNLALRVETFTTDDVIIASKEKYGQCSNHLNALCRILPHIFSKVTKPTGRIICFKVLSKKEIPLLKLLHVTSNGKTTDVTDQFLNLNPVAEPPVPLSLSDQLESALIKTMYKLHREKKVKGGMLRLFWIRRRYNEMVSPTHVLQGSLADLAHILSDKLGIKCVPGERNMYSMIWDEVHMNRLFALNKPVKQAPKRVPATTPEGITMSEKEFKNFFSKNDLLPDLDTTDVDKPVVYIFPMRTAYPTFVYAMAEDGAVLKKGVVTNEMGLTFYAKESYLDHYPDGYRTEVVPAEKVLTHEGLLKAYALNMNIDDKPEL